MQRPPSSGSSASGPLGGESLVGHMIVEALRQHRGDDRRLLIVAALRASTPNALRTADCAPSAATTSLASIVAVAPACGDLQPAPRPRGDSMRDTSAGQIRPALPGSARRRDHSALAERPIRHHVAHGGEALLGRIDAREAESALIRDMDLAIGVADASTSGHTPRVSRMRRLPFESAVVRSSKLGCEAASCGIASIRATLELRAAPMRRRGWRPPCRRPRWRRRNAVHVASAACTRASIASGVFSSAAGQHLRRTGGHQHFILDANADVPEFLRDARRGSDVDPRLDGEHHPRFQHPPFAADLVVADIMHVEARASGRCDD